MLIVNKYVYDWFVSTRHPKLGEYVPTKTINIHKIVNMNAGYKPEQISLIFLTTNQCKLVELEKYLTVYHNQEGSCFVPEGDHRRLLAGRLLRKYKKKNKLK